MPLRQDDLLLRLWQVDDARWYVEARDEEVFRWTTEPRALTVQETEVAIRGISANENLFAFAIVDARSNELVGNIAAVKDESHAGQAEVMYWLAKSGRGRGLATKAVRLLCEWLFTERALERLILKTYKDNMPSQRVAERAGFREFRPTGGKSDKAEFRWYEWTRPMPASGGHLGTRRVNLDHVCSGNPAATGNPPS